MKRLQGREFADMKPQLEMIGYTKSSRGNYCAFMKLKGSNDYSKKFSHWLNNDEAKLFEESEFFKTNKPLTQGQVNNIRSKAALRHEVYEILDAMNNELFAAASAQSKFDNKKQKLISNYTEDLIKEVYNEHKEKFGFLKTFMEEQ